MIAIELNGQPHTVPADHCLQDLMLQLALTQQAFAVAVNREVVPRAHWAARRLIQGDQVDIVKAIGGG